MTHPNEFFSIFSRQIRVVRARRAAMQTLYLAPVWTRAVAKEVERFGNFKQSVARFVESGPRAYRPVYLAEREKWLLDDYAVSDSLIYREIFLALAQHGFVIDEPFGAWLNQEDFCISPNEECVPLGVEIIQAPGEISAPSELVCFDFIVVGAGRSLQVLPSFYGRQSGKLLLFEALGALQLSLQLNSLNPEWSVSPAWISQYSDSVVGGNASGDVSPIEEPVVEMGRPFSFVRKCHEVVCSEGQAALKQELEKSFPKFDEGSYFARANAFGFCPFSFSSAHISRDGRLIDPESLVLQAEIPLLPHFVVQEQISGRSASIFKKYLEYREIILWPDREYSENLTTHFCQAFVAARFCREGFFEFPKVNISDLLSEMLVAIRQNVDNCQGSDNSIATAKRLDKQNYHVFDPFPATTEEIRKIIDTARQTFAGCLSRLLQTYNSRTILELEPELPSDSSNINDSLLASFRISERISQNRRCVGLTTGEPFSFRLSSRSFLLDAKQDSILQLALLYFEPIAIQFAFLGEHGLTRASADYAGKSAHGLKFSLPEEVDELIVEGIIFRSGRDSIHECLPTTLVRV